jgi:pimeloyl-ACP methyl ester carboxylesterase
MSLGLGLAALGSVCWANAANDPSVVLVHGAFADGSDWAKVITLLQAKGVQVRAVQNGLNSLADDVATTRRAIETAPGKVVLVGHSWGGSVITEAGASDKVAALVYVAAFAPDVGQTTRELGKDYPPSPGMREFVADKAGYLSLTQHGMEQDFAPDVSAAQARLMAATQGAINARAFDERISVAAWKQKPSWYIVSERDRMIAPELQRALARKINATTMMLPTSHVPHQSRPADVTKVITEALNTTR